MRNGNVVQHATPTIETKCTHGMTPREEEQACLSD